MSTVSRTERKTNRPVRRVHFGRLFLVAVLAGFLLAFGTGATFFFTLVRGLPSLDELGGIRQNMSSIVYDVNGKEIRNLYAEENRVPIKLAQMPQDLQDAIVAIEDHRFYQHHGVDFRGIIRAVWVDVTGGGLREGASTITQQLARNAILNSLDKNFIRKAKELVYALELERRYTKQEILEAYMNEVNFGNGAYGVQAAAKIYFGKDLTKDTLTLAETSLLAGLPQAPEGYSPYNNPKAAVNRQHEVLDAMVAYGYIKPAEADQARLTYDAENKAIKGVTLVGLKRGLDYTGAWFVDYVLNQLIDKYGERAVYEGGLRIYTTLDLEAQKAADDAVHQVLDKDYPVVKDKPPIQVGAVFMDAQSGAIRAMIGGRVHDHARGLNRAVPPSKPGAGDGVLRQPGSSIKPIVVYSPALDSGITLSTVFDDSPTYYTINGKETMWPENSDFTFRGLTTVHDALVSSINVIATRIVDQLGPAKSIEYAEKFGLPVVKQGRSNDVTLSLAMGGMTNGVSVLDMVSAYSTFPNLGVRQKPLAILKVTDSAGNVLEEHRPLAIPTLKANTAYLMVNMMKDVVTRGTGGQAALPDGRPAAGKTGTTSEFKDAWFMGYTKQLVGGVWLGYDQPKPMKGLYGGMYPARIWRSTIAAMSKKLPAEDWAMPNPGDFVRVAIDIQTGLLPSVLTPPDKIREELFIKGTEPTSDTAPGAPRRVSVMVSFTNPNLRWDPTCGSLPVPRVGLERAVPWRLGTRDRKPADWDQEVPTQTCAEAAAGEQPGQPGQPVQPAEPGQPVQPAEPGQPGQPGAPATQGSPFAPPVGATP